MHFFSFANGNLLEEKHAIRSTFQSNLKTSPRVKNRLFQNHFPNKISATTKNLFFTGETFILSWFPTDNEVWRFFFLLASAMFWRKKSGWICLIKVVSSFYRCPFWLLFPLRKLHLKDMPFAVVIMLFQVVRQIG